MDKKGKQKTIISILSILTAIMIIIGIVDTFSPVFQRAKNRLFPPEGCEGVIHFPDKNLRLEVYYEFNYDPERDLSEDDYVEIEIEHIGLLRSYFNDQRKRG